MAQSKMRQGVLTIFDPDTRRMKQIDYLNGERTRYSRDTYPDEDTAWRVDDRREINWPSWEA
jgi:hypothetical protein